MTVTPQRPSKSFSSVRSEFHEKLKAHGKDIQSDHSLLLHIVHSVNADNLNDFMRACKTSLPNNNAVLIMPQSDLSPSGHEAIEAAILYAQDNGYDIIYHLAACAADHNVMSEARTLEAETEKTARIMAYANQSHLYHIDTKAEQPFERFAIYDGVPTHPQGGRLLTLEQNNQAFRKFRSFSQAFGLDTHPFMQRSEKHTIKRRARLSLHDGEHHASIPRIGW